MLRPFIILSFLIGYDELLLSLAYYPKFHKWFIEQDQHLTYTIIYNVYYTYSLFTL